MLRKKIDMGNVAQDDAGMGRGMTHLWAMVRGAQIGALGAIEML